MVVVPHPNSEQRFLIGTTWEDAPDIGFFEVYNQTSHLGARKFLDNIPKQGGIHQREKQRRVRVTVICVKTVPHPGCSPPAVLLLVSYARFSVRGERSGTTPL